MKTKQIKLRVTDEKKLAFEAAAKASRFGTSSALLEYLTDQALAQMPKAEAEIEDVPPPPKGAGGYVGTRLSPEDLGAVKQLAKSYGGVSPWLRGLCIRALGRPVELPSVEEVLALNAAVDELFHIGNNLNQIARHMNEERRAGLPVNTGALKPELIQRLTEAFEKLADKNVALVARTLERGVVRG
jgi:hypothetical protein